MFRYFPYRLIYFFKACCCLVLIGLLPLAGTAQDNYTYDTTGIIEAPADEFEELDPGFRENAYEAGTAEFRKVPDSTVERIKRLKEFAYANDDSFVKKKKQRDNTAQFWDKVSDFFTSRGVQVIFYTLLVSLIIYIIYRIIVANSLIAWSRSRKKLAAKENALAGITEEENIEEKIRKAVAEKDYRTAVRYMYLKGLHLLRDKGWLRLHAQATNHDYVQQVSRYPVSSDFRFLTDVYDYVWYGEFPVNDRQFERLQSDFQRFYHAVQP